MYNQILSTIRSILMLLPILEAMESWVGLGTRLATFDICLEMVNVHVQATLTQYKEGKIS